MRTTSRLSTGLNIVGDPPKPAVPPDRRIGHIVGTLCYPGLRGRYVVMPPLHTRGSSAALTPRFASGALRVDGPVRAEWLDRPDLADLGRTGGHGLLVYQTGNALRFGIEGRTAGAKALLHMLARGRVLYADPVYQTLACHVERDDMVIDDGVVERIDVSLSAADLVYAVPCSLVG